jgi:hypothetical protein
MRFKNQKAKALLQTMPQALYRAREWNIKGPAFNPTVQASSDLGLSKYAKLEGCARELSLFKLDDL